MSDGDGISVFANAMREIYRRAKSEAGYNATYFLQMLNDVGPVEAARRLLHTATPSEGFTQLYLRNRLDLTVEAHVMQGRFADLFTEEERDIARKRLAQYGYTPPKNLGET